MYKFCFLWRLRYRKLNHKSSKIYSRVAFYALSLNTIETIKYLNII